MSDTLSPEVEAGAGAVGRPDAPAAPEASESDQPLLSRDAAPLAGLVVAAVALAVAELVSTLSSGWRSPVLDVGDRMVDAAPLFVKEFASDTFGTNDKQALLIGIGVLLGVYAMGVVGSIGFRRSFRIGVAGIVAFGFIGAWAARGRRGADGNLGLTIPVIIGTTAAIGAMFAIRAAVIRSRRAAPPAITMTNGEIDTEAVGSDRRRFLTGSTVTLGALGVGALAAGGLGRARSGRYSAADSRSQVSLPGVSSAPSSTAPASTTTPAMSGATDAVPGISSFITPNNDFYRIDTALSVPQLSTKDFSLKLHGMVDNPITLSWDELLDRDLIEREITICCVSNVVNGPLIGNAKWLGLPLRPLLDEAGIDPAADQIVPRSVDGWAGGFPTSVALDGRDVLIAVGMNGEPLPLEHGFPARLIVPGLYGYVSATKWLTEIELTTFEKFQSYWVPRGWAVDGPIKTMARIDTPRREAPAGRVPIAGVAWAQHVGIAKVEVSIDDGPWHEAELGETPSNDTWVQWVYEWDAEPGRHTLRARATDRNGETQTEMRRDVVPDGATGYPTVDLTVS